LENKKFKTIRILFRKKIKYFITNSSILLSYSKEKNKLLFGFKLILIFLKTEIIFLKEKNESAKEQNYWIKDIDNKIDPLKKHYLKKYDFNFMDAFSSNINMWSKFINKTKIRNKNINYLEIGCFEGMSGVFILENLKKARCFFVDPFLVYDELKDFQGLNEEKFDIIFTNFMNNIEDFKERSKVFRETSDSFFKGNDENFDLIYIDGSHFGDDVYQDAVNSLKFLNNGGHIIFDDFFWYHYKLISDNPIGGIFQFLVESKKNIKIKYLGNQLIIQKNSKNFHP
tara:strand:- start:7132 stop:7983 length:852 start_codon:yes stop_codon:yes gene_type:complete